MLGIVIPYFKISFFEKTIISLVNQSNQQFKVYIGDDASPENPLKILSKYENQIDVFYYRFENNLGSVSIVKQWERCLTLIDNEEWIMILGDDDYLDKNVVEYFYRDFEKFKRKSSVIRFSTRTIIENKNIITSKYTHPKIELSTNSLIRKLSGKTRSSLSEYIFKKNMYSKYRFRDFKYAWYSDDWAWLEFSEGGKIFTINDATVFIRMSDENLSGKIKLDSLFETRLKIQFLKSCINELSHLFSNKQLTFLITQLEFELFKSRKIKLIDFRSLFVMYIRTFDIMTVLKFIRRVVLKII